MKTLKIVGIFVLVVGVFVGILYFLHPNKEVSITPETNNVVEQYGSKIDQMWNDVVWDTSVYMRVKGMLNSPSAKKDLKASLPTLEQKNINIALAHLDSVLIAEWAKADCNDKIVSEYIAGVRYIKKDAPVFTGSDNRVKKLEGIYALYSNLKGFCNSSFTLKVKYDIDRASWNSFSSHRNSQMANLNKYKGSEYYKYLSDITFIKNGIAAVPDRLDNAEIRFMKDLCLEIKSQFNNYTGLMNKSRLKNQLSETQERFVVEFKDIIRRNYEAKEIDASLRAFKNNFR